MKDVLIGSSSVKPNAGANANTTRAADIARQGQVGNRRVSTLDSGSPSAVRGQVDNTTVATPSSDRSVSAMPDDPTSVPISWFTERLPASGVGRIADDMRDMVNFAKEIDHAMLRASALLEKSDSKPLNEKEQREVNTLLGASKYNLSQVQHWAMATESELEGSPIEQELMGKLRERLADRHMDLADLMCLYDIDQIPPEHAVSRADRIDHNLIAADTAIKVAGGLVATGLSGEVKQQLVEVLKEHRAELGAAKDIAIGGATNSSRVLTKAISDTSFTLTKGNKGGGIVSSLHRHWDAKAAGAAGRWFPLAHPKLTQERMLQGFVTHRLKQAGVAKDNMPDLEFQFKEATIQTLNERPWKPIEKELHYLVAGESRTLHSKITPAKTMAAGRFAADFTANGICCTDRMQYTHVPNLARTELTNESGATMFSALRHGVLDAYDISASSLRKLPDQELRTTVKDLLVPYATKKTTSEGLDPANLTADLELHPEPPGSGDNNKIAYLGKFSNTCPEQTAIFVANHFNLDCKFETYKNTTENKGQIDISLPLSMNAPAPKMDRPMLFTDGKSEASCFNYLQSLDKSAVYLMRTGENNRSGHNQILYSKDNEWFGYDSKGNQSQLTSRGSLTEAGINRMVKKHATWGSEEGETSISTIQVTKEGARDLIGYIKDFRNEDETTAMANLYDAPANPVVTPTYGDGDYATIDSAGKATDVSDVETEQRVNQIVDAIRMDPTQASKYASAMRTAASANMARELAVAALVGDPAKLQAALNDEVVDINLSSISLLTPDRLRSNPNSRSNERAMLRHQTEALKNLDPRSNSPAGLSDVQFPIGFPPLKLQVRDASGELRTVQANCKVRTFNFGVNAGAVGKAKHIPSHLRGWDKLMGWGYAMERNNPELRALLGDPTSEALGGEVRDKLTGLEDRHAERLHRLDDRQKTATLTPSNREFEAETRELKREVVAMTRNINTLRDAATDAKQIWREGSYNKGGQDPYKMVSRLGMVINEMGETLTFNCKSGKDRTGQLDAELKYLTTLSTATGHLPPLGAPVTPELRQMRSDFTLTSGNLEMQRMNTGLPGFKLNIKEVPGLANFIAGPEMESMYRGGSDYIKS